jgi:hypothetical protein
MNHAKAIGRLAGLAVGLGIGAALAATPGVASADSSSDWLSSIDQLLGALSVPAADPAQALDMQISIGGTDLFPTAGNTATATSDMGNIAIAIGNGADANATDATGDTGNFAFADGANSTAEAGFNGGGDSAVVIGANSTAEAGFIGGEDSAVVIGANSTAEAGFGIPASLPLFPFPIPSDFDLAAAFGDMLHAFASGNFMTDIVP